MARALEMRRRASGIGCHTDVRLLPQFVFLAGNMFHSDPIYTCIPKSSCPITDISVCRGDIAGQSSYPHSLV